MASKLTCIHCFNYLRCSDPSKGIDYKCADFTQDAPLGLGKYGGSMEPIIYDSSYTRQKTKNGVKEDGTLPLPSTPAQKRHYKAELEKYFAEQRNNPLPVDITLDDSAFKMAPNFVEFSTNPYYSGQSLVPFAKQLQVGVNLFSEWCANCTSTEWVVNDPFPHLEVPIDWTPAQFRENIQLLDLGKCPKCGVGKSQQHKEGKVPIRNSLNGIAGQRSGKSQLFAMLACYLTHGMMKLQNPAAHFHQIPSTMLSGRVTALTKQQATSTIWTPLREMILSSPWFQGYFDLLREQERKTGRKMIHYMDTFFDIRGRNLFLSVVTPDMKTLRGGTAYFGGVDELGLFDADEGNKKTRDNADEVYRSISNSMRTLTTEYRNLIETGNFDYMLSPFLGSISSPIDKRDKMMRLKEDAKRDPYIYSFHYATWDFNPNQPRSAFDSDFDSDPIKANRDFGAMPPDSALPYITDINQLAPCLSEDTRNRWLIQPVEMKQESGQNHTTGRLIENEAKDGNKRILALDAGRVDNSYSICLGYYDTGVNKPVIDGVLELIPRDSTLNLHGLYKDVLQPLIKAANVTMLVVDRWQSFQLVDMVRADDGIGSENYSVKYRDFCVLKELVHSGGISLPMPEFNLKRIVDSGQKNYREAFYGRPVAHLLSQFVTVQDNGSTVTKGNRNTDDTFRALTLLVRYLVHPDYRQYCQGTLTKGKIKKEYPGVSIASYSGGFGGGGFGGGGVGGMIESAISISSRR